MSMTPKMPEFISEINFISKLCLVFLVKIKVIELLLGRLGRLIPHLLQRLTQAQSARRVWDVYLLF